MRDSTAFLVAALLARAAPAIATPSPVQVGWTTDFGSVYGSTHSRANFGPDGPWQAIELSVGNVSTQQTAFGSGGPGISMPLYPCGSSLTQVLPPATGADYSYNQSSTARLPGIQLGNPDDWSASVFANSTSIGVEVFDLVTLPLKLANLASFSANATVFQPTDWTIPRPDGSNYTTEVGIFGLGSDTYNARTGGILEQMKNAEVINSHSFGLHIGSAPLNVTGSLILGGFDSSRALGQVGVFQYLMDMPVGVLRDVKLGVEEGGSPFDPASTGSLYQVNNVSDAVTVAAQTFGAPRGTVLVIPNPAAPYIYLPYGTCEAVAQFLPVSWNAHAGLYTWNTTDPQYPRIVNSPAYLEFILADKLATNISIKVPFKLLNLTLESPIVDTPTAYFPCKPFNSTYGFYGLGRAFLQAAFLAVNYDQNLTFLAQAPGPDLDQSVLQTIKPSDTNLTSNPIASFRNSWTNHWTVLPTTNSPSNRNTGLSSGAKAGIALGALAAFALLLLGLLFLLRRMKRNNASREDPQQRRPLADEIDGFETPGVSELHGPHGVSDMSKPLAHEMGAGHGVSDLSRPLAHEMEAGHGLHEAPSHHGGPGRRAG